MQQSKHERDLDKLLFWDVLAAEPIHFELLPAGNHYMLNTGSHYHMTRGREGGLISTPAFKAPDDMGDWVLVNIPCNARNLEVFGKSAAYRHRAIKDIFDNNQLSQGFDYEIIMSYFDKSVENKKFWQLNQTPESFVVAINASSFQRLAAGMLDKLADPAKGMSLAGISRKDRYLHGFQYPDLPATRAIMRILSNANMDPRILSKIKQTSVAHDNFELSRLIDNASSGNHVDLVRRSRDSNGTAPSMDF